MARDTTDPIFRAPMQPRDRDIDPGSGADHGIRRRIVGIGDALRTAPATLDEAVDAAVQAHGGKAGRLLRRFASVPDGAFVWTRTSCAAYRLGRVDGPWRYDASAEAGKVGIHHVRPAKWLEHEFDEQEVPSAVAATFARGGRNFQRVHDDHAQTRTSELWNRFST